jgi:hypothetical protein
MSVCSLFVCKDQKHVTVYFRRGGAFCFRETKDLPYAEQQISNLVSLPVEPIACGKDYIWYLYF